MHQRHLHLQLRGLLHRRDRLLRPGLLSLRHSHPHHHRTLPGHLHQIQLQRRRRALHPPILVKFEFRSFICFAGETIIFFTGGLIVGYKILGVTILLKTSSDFINTVDYYKMFGIYVCMYLCRLLTFVIFRK